MVIDLGNPSYPVRWGKTIREMRELRGLTVQELADAIDVSGQAVRVWESGKFPPSDRNRILLARFFNVQPGVLFDLRLDDSPMETAS
jgi:transcriptional regulator with XRE-family HTH domain